MELKLKINIPAHRYDGNWKALWDWMVENHSAGNTSQNNMSLDHSCESDKSLILRHGPGMAKRIVHVGYIVICCPVSNHFRVMGDYNFDNTQDGKYKEVVQELRDRYWNKFSETFEIIE